MGTVTLRQIDAGLTLLGLNRTDLARHTGIPQSTLNEYFVKNRASNNRLTLMQDYLESAGVKFTDNGGVEPNKDEIRTYIGQQGFVSLMTDVMETARRGGIEICISGVDERRWEDNLPQEFAENYRDQMRKVKGISSKILVKEGDDFLTAEGFAEYRAVPENVFSDIASFYAYGDKLAIIEFPDEEKVKILVLKNKKFADAFRTQFNAIWNNHKVLK